MNRLIVNQNGHGIPIFKGMMGILGVFGLLVMFGVSFNIPSSESLSAQEKTQYGDRSIEPETIANDKDGIYTLNFRLKDPRIIVADVPGRGKKLVWYILYNVYNFTGEPRKFVPEFDFVTLDKNTSHADEILPSVQAQIQEKEFPILDETTGKHRIFLENSVTIAKELIPITKKDSFPRATYGVAMWSDVSERALGTSRFSIFVTGLSDGYTIDDNGIIRRKTLQLNYRRVTDGLGTDTSDVTLDRDKPYNWIYRASTFVPKEEGKEKGQQLLAPGKGIDPFNKVSSFPKNAIPVKRVNPLNSNNGNPSSQLIPSNSSDLPK